MPELKQAGGRLAGLAGERLADLRHISRDDIVGALDPERLARLPIVDRLPAVERRQQRATRDRILVALGISAVVAVLALVLWTFVRPMLSGPVETPELEDSSMMPESSNDTDQDPDLAT
jgi:hypothetical protein